MQTHRLVAHPDTPPSRLRSVTAAISDRDGHWLRLRWRLEGAEALVVPDFAGKGRADELWRTTCFELFLRPAGGEAYCEFNMSPSERWAAYDFDRYREGMQNRPMPRDIVGTMRRGGGTAISDAALPVAALPQAQCAMALTAVIEEEDGTKSFWSLAHPPGNAPDFHDAACFAGTLAAPLAP